MNSQVKALLLGINLRFRESDDGIGRVRDTERENRLNQALERLVIDTDDLDPNTLSEMLDGEEAIEWLAEHQQATIEIANWSIQIDSTEFADID